MVDKGNEGGRACILLSTHKVAIALSGVHFIKMEKLSLAGEGGGCTPTPFQYICHHVQSFFLNIFWGIYSIFFSYYIQHCFICRPSDSTVQTDAGIEPRTVATGALAAY
jgi:hypothetical protein